MATAKKPTKKDASEEQGVVYLSSLGGMYSTTKYDAATLKKYSKNIYGAGVAHKQRNLIFQEKYTITVLDKDRNPDEDLANRLTLMCDQEAVRLWPKIQQAWADVFFYGESHFNPVWGYQGNEYFLQKLRHLPAESFGTAPYTRPVIYSEVLKGVVINPETQEIEYWQTLNPMDVSQFPKEVSAKLLQNKLMNVFVVKDPVSTELAGTPTILPVVPIIAMLDFSWQAQVQKVNRIGAPIFFLKISNPQKDDIAYGQRLLQNWGKNTSYQLRTNFEMIIPDLKDTSTALDTINALSRMIIDYFSPAALLQGAQSSSPLSGSSVAEQELLYSYVRGVHEWISEAFSQLLQVYLDANAYEGYTVTIDIPSPSIDKSDLWLKQAELGARAGAMTTNEIRDFLGLEELDEAGLEELRTDVGIRQPVPLATSPEMAQAELAIKAMSVDKLNPEYITGKKGRQLVQTVLGIENGAEDQPAE